MGLKKVQSFMNIMKDMITLYPTQDRVPVACIIAKGDQIVTSSVNGESFCARDYQSFATANCKYVSDCEPLCKHLSSRKNTISKSPIAHAELQCVHELYAVYPCLKYAYDFSIYVTMEPCLMCMQAISMCKFKSLYFGVDNPLMGAFSTGTFDNQSNIEVYGGFLEQQFKEIIRAYFIKKRSLAIKGSSFK